MALLRTLVLSSFVTGTMHVDAQSLEKFVEAALNELLPGAPIVVTSNATVEPWEPVRQKFTFRHVDAGEELECVLAASPPQAYAPPSSPAASVFAAAAQVWGEWSAIGNMTGVTATEAWRDVVGSRTGRCCWPTSTSALAAQLGGIPVSQLCSSVAHNMNPFDLSIQYVEPL